MQKPEKRFAEHVAAPDCFVVTMELVPKAESEGRSVDTVLGLARDAKDDDRVVAVSITDNPGGHPSLSPDVLSREILETGMDVIVHFTCRDANRAGMQSRALQLGRMGVHNILALTGDFSSKAFGGHSAPVFDLDSVHLLCLLHSLNDKAEKRNLPGRFFTGCAVSPFKSTEPEAYAQYFKMCKKLSARAGFVITQLGYDARRFHELLCVQKMFGLDVPTLASVFFLTPKTAKVMHSNRVPGAVVPEKLLRVVQDEWARHTRTGYRAAVERAARLCAVVKGMGYRGVHIGGVHRSFKTVARILDRIGEIQDRWTDFVPEFDFGSDDCFYLFEKDPATGLSSEKLIPPTSRAGVLAQMHFKLMQKAHHAFFRRDTGISPLIHYLCQRVDNNRGFVHKAVEVSEHLSKKALLGCMNCGDCAIADVAFLCPESQCPKHMRNGACGGSTDGRCEVHPDRFCVWVRAYLRLAMEGRTSEMARGCNPPRMWELANTSSWINFHLDRDHNTKQSAIFATCGTGQCRLDAHEGRKK